MINPLPFVLSIVFASGVVASTALTVASKTFDAHVPNDMPLFYSRGNFTPTYVPFAQIDAVIKDLDRQYKDSYAFAKHVNPSSIFNHARRTTYFATSLLFNGFPSKTPGIPQISFTDLIKRVYLTTIMHDVGLTYDEKILAHPAHDMSFEFYGGIMVYEHINKVYHPGSKSFSTAELGDIVQSTFLHTTQASSGNSSATSMLNVLGATLDIVGFDAHEPAGDHPTSLRRMFNRTLVGEIEAAVPRTGFGVDVRALFIDHEYDAKPTCILGQGPRSGLENAALRLSILDD